MSDESKVRRINRKPVAAEVPDVSGTEISEDEFKQVTREGIRRAADKWLGVPEAIITDKISSSGHGPKFDMPEAEETPTYNQALRDAVAADAIAGGGTVADGDDAAERLRAFKAESKTYMDGVKEQLAAGGGSVYDYLGRGFDAERAVAKIAEGLRELAERQNRDDTMHWKQHQESSERHYKLVNEFGDFVRDFGEYVQDEGRRHQQAQLVTLAVVAAVAFAIGRAR